MTLLVTGATGTVGSALVPALSDLDESVRVMVPTREFADDLRGYDVEVAVGNLDHPETLDDALKGVRAAFLVVPAGPDLATRELAFLDAVERAADQPHVIKLAALGWQEPQSRLTSEHATVIKRLRSSGLRHTVLAPNGFMQDILRFAAMVQEESALLLPAGTGAVSHVDARDVAAVAAHVLTRPEAHEGRAYDVTGPRSLTYAEVAEALSEVAGKSIEYVETAADEVRKRMLGYGWSEWTADGMLEVYAAYAAGAADVVTDEVEKATGRSACELRTFLREYAAAFRTV